MSNGRTLADAGLVEDSDLVGGTVGTRGLALFALALGTFCTGTTEFASMGLWRTC